MQQLRSEQPVMQYMPCIVFAEYKTLTKSQRIIYDVLRVNISTIIMIYSQSCINAAYKRFNFCKAFILGMFESAAIVCLKCLYE